MIEQHGSADVPQLVLNREGKGNSLTVAMLEQLAETFDGAVAAGARAMVISGANGRFCAGADLTQLTGTPADAAFDTALAAVTERIVTAPLCVVAAVEKYAFGAGVDLAWSCDVVVVAESARVAVPATRFGILYNPPALQRLHARVGSRALRQLLVAGREIAGVEIADVVVKDGNAVDVALGVAEQATMAVPAAIEGTKRVLNDFDHGIHDSAEWERIRQDLLASPERGDAINNRDE